MSTTMSASTEMQCPRGHDLVADSVYCHVCWVRVEPVDPASVKRVRNRRWSPLLVTASVLAGVALGGAVASYTTFGGSNPFTSMSSAVVAAEPVTAEPEPVAAEPVAVAVAAQPMAATVIVPVSVCVPNGTAAVELRNAGAGSASAAIPAQTSFNGQGSCAAGELQAVVTPEAPIADGTALDATAVDGSGAQLAQLSVTTPRG